MNVSTFHILFILNLEIIDENSLHFKPPILQSVFISLKKRSEMIIRSTNLKEPLQKMCLRKAIIHLHFHLDYLGIYSVQGLTSTCIFELYESKIFCVVEDVVDSCQTKKRFSTYISTYLSQINLLQNYELVGEAKSIAAHNVYKKGNCWG